MIVGSFLKDGMIVESETFIDSNNDDFSAIGICVSSKCRNLDKNIFNVSQCEPLSNCHYLISHMLMFSVMKSS